MTDRQRRRALIALASFIKHRRPALKAAAVTGDGKEYGRLWREIENEAERQGLGDELAILRGALSPDALRTERIHERRMRA